jgi:small subunit ribosomal protein S1
MTESSEHRPPPAGAEPPAVEGDEPATPDFATDLKAFEREKSRTAPGGAPARGTGAPKAAHRIGDRVRGRVVSVSGDVVLLDVGGRAEAVADAREFRSEDGQASVAIGDSLELHVVQAGEPLTLARAAPRRGRRSVSALRQARESGLPVRGRVTAVNPGGLTIDVDGVRAFCPLSHIDEQRVEDPATFVGRSLEFLVEEVDESRARVVVSRRRLLARQRADALRDRLASLAPGQELEGAVARLEPYGAFVDLGGVEGLVYVSEISHERLAHPRDAIGVGDKVRVRVLEVDRGKGGRPRIALSIRALAPDPWITVAARFPVGSRHPGVVVRLADFGAFVNLAPGIDGLVHVSHVSDRRITHVREVLSPGQAVEVLVLGVEPERKRISLSIRDAAATDPGRSEVTEHRPGPRAAATSRERGPRAPRREASRGDRAGSRPGRSAAPAPEPRSRPDEPPALTPMQLAFKLARERMQEREG